MTARRAMLASIRAALRGVAVPPLPPIEPPPPPGPGDPALFRARAEAAGVEFHDSLASALGEARAVALSDAPMVRAAVVDLASAGSAADAGRAPRPARHFFDGWSDRARLLAADAGVSTAQFGIAETGTVVLIGDEERHRLVSLLPPLHVVLLRRDRIVPTLGAALAALQPAGAGPSSPLVTFVTGPSRTADIELQLVLGVHGPRALRIVLVEAPPDAGQRR